MKFYCTKKLLDAGGFTPEEIVDCDPLFSWYANIMKVNRKNFVVLINEKTNYPIFFYGMKKKDLQKLPYYMAIAIEYAFENEEFPRECIHYYLQRQQTNTFHKTNCRRKLGHLNITTRDALFQEIWEFDEEDFHMPFLSETCSDMIHAEKNEKGYVVPKEEMLKELKALYANGNIKFS